MRIKHGRNFNIRRSDKNHDLLKLNYELIEQYSIYVELKKKFNLSGMFSTQYGARAQKHCEEGTAHVGDTFNVFNEGANLSGFRRIYSPISAIKQRSHFPRTE